MNSDKGTRDIDILKGVGEIRRWMEDSLGWKTEPHELHRMFREGYLPSDKVGGMRFASKKALMKRAARIRGEG